MRFDYCGLAPLVNEIERFFRIDDRALKYMTVLLNRDVDLEKIKEEKAAREAAAAESAAAETATAETATAVNPSDPDNAPEEDQIKEVAPAEEKAKNNEDVPPSETEGSAADKTPPSTKEEA